MQRDVELYRVHQPVRRTVIDEPHGTGFFSAHWFLFCGYHPRSTSIGELWIIPELAELAAFFSYTRHPRRFAVAGIRMGNVMRAMVLEEPRTPLVMRERARPVPAAGEILVEVAACGVCRTDLHVVDGELPHPKLPIVPGHEIVGRIAALGRDVAGFCRRRAHRRAVARLHLWRLSLLPRGARESLRSPAVHRLYPRRRLCHACACGCALLFSAAGAHGRCAKQHRSCVRG